MKRIPIWTQLVALYVITYMVSIPWTFLTLKYSSYVSNSGFMTAMNYYFVRQYGYGWFVVVYFALIGCNIKMRALTDPERSEAVNKTLWKRKGINFLINAVFGIMTNYWFFGRSIFERFDVISGGHCASDPAAWRISCENHWIEKFDASGHYYILLSMSFLIWDLLLGEDFHFWTSLLLVRNLTIDKLTSWLIAGTNIVALVLLAIWYFEYVVTSLFFHTVLEKFVGLLFGFVIPLLLRLRDGHHLSIISLALYA